jgi:flavin reductase (DIM6/NTAB) family NADH-FMN oxidoreductase RutF
MGFKRIAPEQLQVEPVRLFGKDWMLLTAGGKEKHNTMTVAWGGLGMLWGLPVATVYVRPERLTYSFLNENESFTLCAFDENWREKLVLCGTKSGREVDKDALCGLTPVESESGAVYYAEARLAVVCKKIYTQDFDLSRIADERVRKIYSHGEQLHSVFVGEILEVLAKED